MSRSEGARLLGKVCEARTQAVVAEELGVSRQAVASWLSGVKGPADERRETIERLFGIVKEAWDRTPDTAATVTNQPPPSPLSPANGSAFERAKSHLTECDAALAKHTDASPRELSALLNARATAIRALDGATSNWRRILESPEWRTVEGALTERCKDSPELAEIVAEWLRELRSLVE